MLQCCKFSSSEKFDAAGVCSRGSSRLLSQQQGFMSDIQRCARADPYSLVFASLTPAWQNSNLSAAEFRPVIIIVFIHRKQVPSPAIRECQAATARSRGAGIVNGGGGMASNDFSLSTPRGLMTLFAGRIDLHHFPCLLGWFGHFGASRYKVRVNVHPLVHYKSMRM